MRGDPRRRVLELRAVRGVRNRARGRAPGMPRASSSAGARKPTVLVADDHQRRAVDLAPDRSVSGGVIDQLERQRGERFGIHRHQAPAAALPVSLAPISASRRRSAAGRLGSSSARPRSSAARVAMPSDRAIAPAAASGARGMWSGARAAVSISTSDATRCGIARARSAARACRPSNGRADRSVATSQRIEQAAQIVDELGEGVGRRVAGVGRIAVAAMVVDDRAAELRPAPACCSRKSSRNPVNPCTSTNGRAPCADVLVDELDAVDRQRGHGADTVARAQRSQAAVGPILATDCSFVYCRRLRWFAAMAIFLIRHGETALERGAHGADAGYAVEPTAAHPGRALGARLAEAGVTAILSSDLPAR